MNISVSNLDKSAQFFTHFLGFIIKKKLKLNKTDKDQDYKRLTFLINYSNIK